MVARMTHDHKVGGSNPSPVTKNFIMETENTYDLSIEIKLNALLAQVDQELNIIKATAKKSGIREMSLVKTKLQEALYWNEMSSRA